jgi:hypothetical protein
MGSVLGSARVREKTSFMPTIKTVIMKDAIATYFALTFAISWGGVLAVAGPKIPPTREEFERLLPIVVVMMLTGPSIAGILLTGFVYGRAGLRKFRFRLLKWRVDARWCAAALLIAPALMTALLLGLSLISPEFLPGIVISRDKTVLVLSGFAIALGAGICEELGWKVRDTNVAVALRCACNEAHDGSPVSSVALVRGRFGKRHSFRNALPDQLPARSFPIPGRFPGAYGLGVRPHREPAHRNPDAF